MLLTYFSHVGYFLMQKINSYYTQIWFQPEWKLWAERGLTKVKIKEKPEASFLRKYSTIISMYI